MHRSKSTGRESPSRGGVNSFKSGYSGHRRGKSRGVSAPRIKSFLMNMQKNTSPTLSAVDLEYTMPNGSTLDPKARINGTSLEDSKIMQTININIDQNNSLNASQKVNYKASSRGSTEEKRRIGQDTNSKIVVMDSPSGYSSPYR